jgi:hypothetical protein
MTSMADRVLEVRETIEGLSQSAKEFFASVSEEILDFAQDNQLAPRELAAALGQIIGGLALTEAQNDPEDNETIDDFLEFARAALHVGAAHTRIKAGWEPR